MRLLIAVPLALAACSGPTADQPAVAPTTETAAIEAPVPTPAGTVAAGPLAPAKREADYLGRWTGVEGMYLVVTSQPKGGVEMEMQYDLDHKGTYQGSVTAEGLRFMRDGMAETAVPGDGDATGLKYLAGKKDCLTVQPGEGYCRD